MFSKTKARLKLHDSLRGNRTNFTVVGCLLFKEWDTEDQQYYYWEEWELLGMDDYDSWVEYDHYNREVSTYEPVNFQEKLDPAHFRRGQEYELTDKDGNLCRVRVKEVGQGVIAKIIGKNTYQVFEGEKMIYATLKMTDASGRQSLITVEKYNNREYDAYRKVKLSKERQKALFGRVLTPFNWGLLGIIVFYAAIALIILLANLLDRKDGHDGGSSGSGASRSVFGGGSGGFGK